MPFGLARTTGVNHFHCSYGMAVHQGECAAIYSFRFVIQLPVRSMLPRSVAPNDHIVRPQSFHHLCQHRRREGIIFIRVIGIGRLGRYGRMQEIIESDAVPQGIGFRCRNILFPIENSIKSQERATHPIIPFSSVITPSKIIGHNISRKIHAFSHLLHRTIATYSTPVTIFVSTIVTVTHHQ